jgi:hypothetical protein
MSLKMAHKVILPPKKNYIPQFLKQRDINSYYATLVDTSHFMFAGCYDNDPWYLVTNLSGHLDLGGHLDLAGHI